MVNVIIPCYKSKDTLPDALDSLVTQTKKMFFVTVVQDADGEDYTDIINEYQKRGLHLFLIKREENGGPGLARQTGIDKSDRFDYIMFLDADDMLMPRAIELLYSEAKKNGDLNVISSNIEANKTGEAGGIIIPEYGSTVWTHGKLYKTSFLKENNIRFHPNLRLNEDMYFNMLVQHIDSKHYKIPYVTYFWRDNKNSITRSGEEFSFLNKSDECYLRGVYYVIETLKEKNIKIIEEVIESSMKKSYIHFSKYSSVFNKNPNDIEILKKYWEFEEVRKWWYNEKNWDSFIASLDAGLTIEKRPVFYKMNFEEWFNKYIKGE